MESQQITQSLRALLDAKVGQTITLGLLENITDQILDLIEPAPIVKVSEGITADSVLVTVTKS